MSEYHAIKWVDDNTATRKTREVDLKCSVSPDGKSIILTGTADLPHHLVEDSAILLKKMTEKFCGGNHG